LGFPAINLGEHGFHFWLADLVLGIPPIECAQRFIDWIMRSLRFGDQSQRELMNEPRVGTRIARGIDGFFAPLEKTLGVRERSLFFRVSGGGKEKYFRFDLFGF